MGAILIKTGDNYNSSAHAEYQLASQADLAEIPSNSCAVGSIAYIHDLSKMWIYGEDEQWHEV